MEGLERGAGSGGSFCMPIMGDIIKKYLKETYSLVWFVKSSSQQMLGHVGGEGQSGD